MKLMSCRSICILLMISSSSAEAGGLPGWIEAEVNAGVGTLRGYAADASVTVSPWSPIYESGPKFRFTAAQSVYTFRDIPADPTLSKERDTALDLLVGYAYQADWWSLLGLVGPTALQSVFFPVESPFSETTTKLGTRAVVVLDANPTDQTMVFAQGNYSTIKTAYLVEAKFGAAALPKVFIGPEVSFSHGVNYEQRRVGAFIFGPVGSLLAEISIGYVNDPNQGAGAYL